MCFVLVHVPKSTYKKMIDRMDMCGRTIEENKELKYEIQKLEWSSKNYLDDMQHFAKLHKESEKQIEDLQNQLKIRAYSEKKMFDEIERLKVALGKKTKDIESEDPFVKRVKELEDLVKAKNKELSARKIEVTLLNKLRKQENIESIEASFLEKINKLEGVVQDLIEKKNDLQYQIQRAEIALKGKD